MQILRRCIQLELSMVANLFREYITLHYTESSDMEKTLLMKRFINNFLTDLL